VREAVAVVTLLLTSTAALGASVAPGAARVSLALALVTVAADGATGSAAPTRTGTAFAVSTAPGRTVFLTAAHVVGCMSVSACSSTEVTVYLSGELRNPRRGHVIAIDDLDGGRDIAAFVVDEGPLPTVDLGSGLGVGHAAAALGYPGATLGALSDRRIEASATAVLSLGKVRRDDGFALEGDFETFPGDSGGPVFDPLNGSVSGIVHGQAPNAGPYLAVGAAALNHFVKALPEFANSATVRTATPVQAPNPTPRSLTGTPAAASMYAAALKVRTSDPGEYARDLRAAADAGNGLAADDLGLAYRSGTGLSKDQDLANLWIARAVELLKTAAQNSDSAALFRLGQIAERGELLPLGNPLRYSSEYTEKIALDYVSRAAALGNADAMLNLGRDYHSGYLVTRDAKQARYWYCAAAVAGSADAAGWLGFLYSDKSDAPELKDPALSSRWYGIANEIDSSPATGMSEARTLCRSASLPR